MIQKDNLEQLYRERYKNLETTPREDLWAGIAARLPEKESRTRIIPLWYKLAGAAAVISLLAVIGIGYFNSTTNVTTQIVYLQSSEASKTYNVTSEEFEQSMSTSGEILKALRESTLAMQNRQQIFYTSKNDPQEKISSAERTVNPVKLMAGRLTEELVIHEKLNPQLYPKNEVANLETDLNDLLPDAAQEEELSIPKEKPPKGRKFELKTTAAAVYFDNLGGGNAIDNQFAGNRGQGDISFSYGIAVAYKISEKLSVRSGINKVDLSYNTRDVSYGSAISAAAVENTDTRIMSLSSPVMGYLNQSLGFVEVPLELKYGIINDKIGLNVIGGASTFFLNENNITLEAGAASTSLGEAGNLNNVSFSTNIGLGLDYNISPQFQLNVEPIFKYQINTFNNTSDVKPYYFGVYSGVSFKF